MLVNVSSAPVALMGNWVVGHDLTEISNGLSLFTLVVRRVTGR
jgi:hypothetical protein